eukprot:8449312-Ditylum_brightwellii.AAC.1
MDEKEVLLSTGPSHVTCILVKMSGRYELGAHLWHEQTKTKKKQYMAQVKRIDKELTNSLKNKNANVLHYVSLLNAERAALTRTKNQEDDARKLYNDAISISARGGYVHDAALAQERFAGYLFNSVGDLQEAKYHLEGAIQRYTDWVAMG